jgi:ketosteroid isomerase-like protein
MRKLALLASLAAAAACGEAATDPAGPSMTEVSAAGGARLDLRPERASLIAAGNAVSDAIARRGLVAGLGNAFNQNALLLSPRQPTIEGKAAITTFLSGDPIAPSAMQWKVIVADVSNDASRGFTWAQGTYTIDLGSGAAETAAFFLTWWHRTESGGWKIDVMVLNQGGPQPLPLPRGFGTPGRKYRRNFPDTDVAQLRRELRTTDAAFSALSVAEGTGPAFERYAAPSAIAVSGGFVFGPEAIGEAFASGPDDEVSWAPRFADAARSGDLGMTVGDAVFELAEFGTFYTKYLTVWRKQDNGEWLFVADFGNSRPAP